MPSRDSLLVLCAVGERGLHDGLGGFPHWELQPHLEDVRELQQVESLPGGGHQELLLPLQGSRQPPLSANIGPSGDVEMVGLHSQVVADSRVERLAPADLIRNKK